MAGSLGLLDLTDDLLEEVLMHLPSKERAACALLCRRLAQVTASSQRLWRVLAVMHHGEEPEAGPMAHLLPFLARGRHVESLTLSWGWLDASFGDFEAAVPTIAALAGAVALCAPTLRVLSLQLPDAVNYSTIGWLTLGQWAAVPRRLQWLHVCWCGLELTPFLASLTQLKGLWLEVNSSAWNNAALSMELAPGRCFPPSLEYLRLDCIVLKHWPAEALAGAAGSLRYLDVGEVQLDEPDSWEQLAQLTALTALVLSGNDFAAALPAALAGLPLRALRLDYNVFANPSADPFACLTELRSLTELQISSDHAEPPLELLETLPLRILDICFYLNGPVLQPSSCAWMHTLSALRCTVQQVLELAPLLPDARQLATLALRLDGPLPALEELSAMLLRMPALATLLLEGGPPDLEGAPAELQAAMHLARPTLSVLVVPADVMAPDAFPSSFEYWNDLSDDLEH